MQSAYLDGFQIHSSTTNPNGIYMNVVKGLGASAIRYVGQDRIGMSGHDPINVLYGGRSLPWQGYIEADNVTTYNQRRRALAGALYAARDANGNPVQKLLTFTMDDGTSYQANVVINATPDLTHDFIVGGDSFLLPMFAPEPQIYSQGQVTVGPVTPPKGSGIVVPFIVPFVLGASSGGNLTAINNGTMETWPVITLPGSLTRPYFRNNTTGISFQLTTTLATSDVVVIDMHPGKRSITLNNSSSLINALTDDSDWISLAPGTNQFSFSSGSTSDTGTMSMGYYHAWAGV